MNLSTKLGALTLRSPLIAAAGTVGSVFEFDDTIDFTNYGAAVAKSVSPEPWEGRPSPRIAAVGSGMLNGIGIQNPGIEEWLAVMSPRFAEFDVPVWGSAVAHDVDGFADVASKMGTSGVEAIEVNLSCPNLEGRPFALDAALSGEVIRAVRASTTLPIGAKLSPDASSVSSVAESAVGAGADWIVMGNTAMGAAIDIKTRRPMLSGVIGGYSGAPLRPITMRCVIEIRRDLPDVPIVACGGVSDSDHVVEFLLAGADAVAIGSAHFDTPRVATRIMRDFKKYLTKHSISDVQELQGAHIPWF